MHLLTLREKIEIFEISTKNSIEQTAIIFNQRHPERIKALDPRTVSRLKHKFNTSGSLERKKRAEGPTLPKSEAFQVTLQEHLEENPHASLEKLAQHFGTSKSTVHRTLKSMKYRSYKMSIHQQLLGIDNQSRQRFCQSFLERIELDQTFLENVLFSDESIFRAKGAFNRQTFRLIFISKKYHRDSNTISYFVIFI